LLIIQGPDKGRRFKTADGKAVLLGRASEQFTLTDFTMSRRHAEIRPSGRGWTLEDLRSANGTYLNSKRLQRPTRLRHGDQIRMGGTTMVWDGSEDAVIDSNKPAAPIVAEMVDLDGGGDRGDASIIGSVAGNEDSIILASPAAAEAVRSWRVMSALLDAVSAVVTPQQLAERMIDILFEEVPADRGFILIKDPMTGKFETEVVRQRDESPEKIRAHKAILDHVIERKEGILASNSMSDSRFAAASRESAAQNIGLRSVICVPLVAREQVLGVIYVDCEMSRHIHTEEQLRLVAAIGQMAGLALEDVRLVNERMRTERLAATGETVAALSHYIKNILQGMSGGSDIIEMGLRQQLLPTVDQGWQVFQRNLDKIYSLTTNMLAFAKQRTPRLAPVQLNAIVEDVLKLVQRRADDKAVLVQGEPSEMVPAVLMDEDGIHQVALNIVVNAIDAVAKSTGVVKVKTALDPTGQWIVLTVGDNGPGIPEAMQDRVFDAFYSTKGHGGTGLGLAVAKKIVDEHAGRIEVTSVPGEGTLIRISLPISAKPGIDSAGTHGPAFSPIEE
jgi:signal transduction histidine kinase